MSPKGRRATGGGAAAGRKEGLRNFSFDQSDDNKLETFVLIIKHLNLPLGKNYL